MSARDDASAPDLSIVVPSHNRLPSVVRLLRAVRAQVDASIDADTVRCEVIIVSDGSMDGTAAALRASVESGEWPFAVTVVEHAVAMGAGIARNTGAAQARGRILLFIDDDIEPFAGSLREHMRLHADAESRGHALIIIGAPVPVRAAHASLQHIAAWGWWEQQFERMSRPGHRFTYDEVFTGVLSMPRALFDAVGGFDATLSGCHEDSELGLRCFRAGARTTFSRVAGGVHHEVRNLAALLPRKRDEGHADVRLLRRWPELSTVVRATDRRPAALSRDGLLRRSAAAGAWQASVLARLALPLLALFDRMRMRHHWRLVHGALLTHAYWRGVADECGSPHALARLRADCAMAVQAWHANARHIRIDLAAGLTAAESILDAQRPDAITLYLGDECIGDVAPRPEAERLHGGHLRRILATTLSDAMQLAMALQAMRQGTSEPSASPATATRHEAAVDSIVAPHDERPSRDDARLRVSQTPASWGVQT